MLCFKYDALLKVDKTRYTSEILRDIDERWGKMLDAGATTFWETEEGYKDFNGAGSLCHGWSAIPVYYYHILLNKNRLCPITWLIFYGKSTVKYGVFCSVTDR